MSMFDGTKDMLDTIGVALTFTLQWEGGYSQDPHDAGNWTGGKCGAGELKGTKFGISAAQYPYLDIFNLDEVEARQIYQRDYWTVIKAGALPPRLAVITFDAAVNAGPKRAIQFLQTALGVGADGQIGDLTIAAAKNSNDNLQVCQAAILARLSYNMFLEADAIFFAGWARRLVALSFYVNT